MSKTPEIDECVGCGTLFQPVHLILESMCLECSLLVNDHVIANQTNIKGNVTRKKLLKRRLQLKELEGRIPVVDTPRKENSCLGCGNPFITDRTSEERYCVACRPFHEQLRQLREKRHQGL